MTEYTITIDGYESGLTRKTVEQMMREQFGGQDVEIHVTEDQSSVSVKHCPPYVNIFSDGRLVASLSEQHDELLIYQSGTDEPIGKHTLSDLRYGLPLADE